MNRDAAVVADLAEQLGVSLSEIAAELMRRGHRVELRVADPWDEECAIVSLAERDSGFDRELPWTRYPAGLPGEVWESGMPPVVCGVSPPTADGDPWLAYVGEPDLPGFHRDLPGEHPTAEAAMAAADEAAREEGWVLL